MSDKPEFRVTVEIVLKHNNKILIMKRSEKADVAPGAWCLPAGKVKFEELPEAGALRECKEETGLDANIIKEIARRARTIKKGGQDAYRLIFTYLMAVEDMDAMDKVIMNDEHSEFVWVSATALKNPLYNLLPDTKELILKEAFLV